MQGEVYRIDDKMLNWLDEFEGHPTYYERDTLKVFVTEETERKPDETDGKETESHERSIECLAYFLKKFPPHMLKHTAYCNYSSDAVDGRTYNEG